VEAAASARCARSAPPVMLPASTTWRNRLRSVRSKRIEHFPVKAGAGFPQKTRAYCQSAWPSNSTKENYAKYLLSAKSRVAIFAIDEAILVGTGALPAIAAAGDFG